MKAEFTIKNYRCFEDEHPLRFILEDGFTAFVGPNNCGKSSILKFFHEFKHLWSMASLPSKNLINLMAGSVTSLNFLSVVDQSEVFCDINKRNLIIEVALSLNEIGTLQVSKVIFIIHRLRPDQSNCTSPEIVDTPKG